jgi:nucleotide-binding universal stress UspA family protein
VDLAQAAGASLTVMAVVPDLSSWILAGGGFAAPDIDRIDQENQAQYEAVLTEALEHVPETIAAESVLAHGPAGPAIVDQVDRGGHDLVVMGSRGRGDATSLLLGSVSHNVLNTSSAAVLIVHGAPDR